MAHGVGHPASRPGQETLDRLEATHRSRPRVDWSTTFYQYTNRLSHLYFLRALNKLPAFHVFVYFLNTDDMHGPSAAEEWMGALHLVNATLRLDEARLAKTFGDAIIDVFIDVRDITAATGSPR